VELPKESNDGCLKLQVSINQLLEFLKDQEQKQAFHLLPSAAYTKQCKGTKHEEDFQNLTLFNAHKL
jgi:hypothetical protein